MTSAPDRPRRRRIAVIGGGIAGLSAAHTLAQSGKCDLTLFEASQRLGGTIETLHQDGFTIECGPDSWVSDKPAARELAVQLGLGDQLMYSNDAIRRNYLANKKALIPMPDGMRMMVPTRWLPILESPLFSWQARLAYLREPKRAEELKAEAAARPESFDESVRAFVTRHFGVEATETIAGPLLAGVFGGDIDTLSAAAVLAPFVRLEREHGSLIAPMMRQAQALQAAGQAPTPIFTTLRCGLQGLTDALTKALPAESIRLGEKVSALARAQHGWQVVSEERKTTNFDAVVLATPADTTAALLTPLDADAAWLLQMEASSAIVVALCWNEQAARGMRIPRGFGFLVPPASGLSDKPTLLAGTFMDQKFAQRAPNGAIFLRGFFGGRAAPHMMHWEDDDRIAAAAHRQFARLLGPLPASSLVCVRRWPRSLPQYAVGHIQRMRQLDARIAMLPSLALTGNAYRGVGIPTLIEDGQRAARAALASNPRSEHDA